ncbi:hypothetical protein Hdeb2414_s0010g00333641 [Helianthus debilis subsp. tardiflorus]
MDPIPKTHNQDLNLKATELRLGLPGSESPERTTNGGVKNPNLVSGAKRGFSDTINFVKNGAFLGENKSNTSGKDTGVSSSPKVPVAASKIYMCK